MVPVSMPALIMFTLPALVVLVVLIVIAAIVVMLSIPCSRMFMGFWSKLLVVVIILPCLVFPVIVIAVILNPLMGMFSDSIGNMFVMRLRPRPVVIGRGIPGITVVQIVYVPKTEQIITDSDSDVETKFGWLQKERWAGNSDRWIDINRLIDINGLRTSNIHPDTYTDIGSMGKWNRTHNQSNTEQQFSHGKLSFPEFVELSTRTTPVEIGLPLHPE
jgi:hypothetical protein